MTRADLEELEGDVETLEKDINSIVVKRIEQNDPMDDRLSLFRQQASIITRKKEAAADRLRELTDDVQQLQQVRAEGRWVGVFVSVCTSHDAYFGTCLI